MMKPGCIGLRVGIITRNCIGLFVRIPSVEALQFFQEMYIYTAEIAPLLDTTLKGILIEMRLEDMLRNMLRKLGLLDNIGEVEIEIFTIIGQTVQILYHNAYMLEA